ncbi:SseA Rhodanese-related sulfurtransferase [Burkholderiaceae bacterium]|jgi:thiosulfate/3-mercaptopyruvate sulfurtransferase
MKKIQWLVFFASTLLVGIAQALSLPGPVVSAEWLAKNLAEVQIVEVRTDISSFTRSPEFVTDKATGKKSLSEVGGHIENSTLLNFKNARVERMLDGRKVKSLIPEQADFQKYIQAVGINANKPIILVPVGQDIADVDEALRMYWQFKVYGENQVAVLDGGMAGWLAEGRPFVLSPAAKRQGSWLAKEPRKELIATSEDVANASKNGSSQLIDSRLPMQYFGTAKKPDVGAYGHIAGAKQFSPDLLTKSVNGALYFFKPETYSALMIANGIKPNGPAISYCNTGHLASGTWFVISELVGNKSIQLYDGSAYLWTLEGRPLQGVPLN